MSGKERSKGCRAAELRFPEGRQENVRKLWGITESWKETVVMATQYCECT